MASVLELPLFPATARRWPFNTTGQQNRCENPLTWSSDVACLVRRVGVGREGGRDMRVYRPVRASPDGCDLTPGLKSAYYFQGIV